MSPEEVRMHKRKLLLMAHSHDPTPFTEDTVFSCDTCADNARCPSRFDQYNIGISQEYCLEEK